MDSPGPTTACVGCGTLDASSAPSSGVLDVVEFGGTRFRLRPCTVCGLEWWDPPQPVDVDFYAEQMSTASTAFQQRHTRGARQLGPNHQAFLGQGPVPGGQRLLDIGCGDGGFLEAAKSLGFSVSGLDLDEAALEVARWRGIDDVSSGTLADHIETVAGAGTGPFDVVTFFEVLEHQPEPMAFMDQVRSLLGPGGRIAGSVPNRRRITRGLDQSADCPPNHYTRWDADALDGFLKRVGASHVRVRSVGSGYWVRTGASRALAGLRQLGLRWAGGSAGADTDTGASAATVSLDVALDTSGTTGARAAILRAARAAKELAVLPPALLEAAYEAAADARLYLYFEARFGSDER